jgi:predicted RNA-binding protein with PUA-like domain
MPKALSYCSKEGFPDFNAWDPLHPYYDPKSSSDSPTWFMVELTFIRHLPHLVSLKLLQYLATLNDPPDCLPYLTKAGLEGIKEMKLLRGGRLSVQPVEEIVYGAIGQLGMKGGWEGIDLKKEIEKSKPKVNKTKTNSKNEDEEEVEEEQEEEPKKVVKTRAVAKKVTKPKVKAEDDDDDDEEREEEEDDEEKVVKKQKVVKKPRVSAAKSTKEPKARRSEWWQTE